MLVASLAGRTMPTRHDAPEFLRGALTGMRVLLVEDAPDNRLLFERFLMIAGVDVDVAENGAEALLKADPRLHDVILMDIQMPVLDGREAAATLRNRGFSRPIIALTASGHGAEHETQFDAYLTKPISQSSLVAELTRWYHVVPA